MPKIYVKFNSAVIKEFEITKDITTFGRKPGNDLVIDNPAISGFHGKFILENSQYFIEDLNSTNGTYINGQRIKKSPLKNKDQISIARYVFEFVVDGSAPTLAEQLAEISQEAAPTPVQVTPPPSPASKDSVNPIKKSPPVSAIESYSSSANLSSVHPDAMNNDVNGLNTANKPSPAAILKVLSGGAGQKEYTLKDLVTYIGSADQAIIKLKGLLVPAIAAAISKKPDGFFLKAVKPGYPKVDGRDIQDQVLLEHGAQIEVGGMALLFQDLNHKKSVDSKPAVNDK